MDYCTTVNCLSGVMYALRPKAHNLETNIHLHEKQRHTVTLLWAPARAVKSIGPVEKHEHTHTTGKN